jgi:hypothetical protein
MHTPKMLHKTKLSSIDQPFSILIYDQGIKGFDNLAATACKFLKQDCALQLAKSDFCRPARLLKICIKIVQLETTQLRSGFAGSSF